MGRGQDGVKHYTQGAMSGLLSVGILVLCLINCSWCQIEPTRCTFYVSPPKAQQNVRIRAWLVGGNPKTIEPGKPVYLMSGNWHFQVSAPGYRSISPTIRVFGARYTTTFRLPPLGSTIFKCPTCGKEFADQASLDRHKRQERQELEKRTWVMVEQIQPADAELVLDGRTPIKRGGKIRVSPGWHTITGESSRGYLKEPYEPPYKFEMTAGQPKTIAKITVPDNAPPSLKIGSVDPPEAKITVNGSTTYKGKTIGPGTTVKIKPEAGANSAKFNVTVTGDDYKTWTQERELKWKEEWKIPDPLVLTRLRWADVRLKLEPAQIDMHTKVWLEDAGVRHELKHGPEVTRLDLGDAARKVYNVKVSPPPDYREKNPGQTVDIQDHTTRDVVIELVKKEGRLRLAFDPKPASDVTISVYDKSGARLTPGDDGTYWLAPDVQHNLVCKADGFQDYTLTELKLSPGETRPVTISMKPLPGILKLKVEPRDALVEITADGKVVATDKSGTSDRAIELNPNKDGSPKMYHYSVAKPGFTKDLLNETWKGDATVERDKTVSPPDTIVLKSIKEVLEGTLARDANGRVIVEKNHPAIRDGLRPEELEAAARLATRPSVKDEIVWGGVKWRDMPAFYREKAAQTAKQPTNATKTRPGG